MSVPSKNFRISTAESLSFHNFNCLVTSSEFHVNINRHSLNCLLSAQVISTYISARVLLLWQECRHFLLSFSGNCWDCTVTKIYVRGLCLASHCILPHISLYKFLERELNPLYQWLSTFPCLLNHNILRYSTDGETSAPSPFLFCTLNENHEMLFATQIHVLQRFASEIKRELALNLSYRKIFIVILNDNQKMISYYKR